MSGGWNVWKLIISRWTLIPIRHNLYSLDVVSWFFRADIICNFILSPRDGLISCLGTNMNSGVPVTIAIDNGTDFRVQ